MKKGSRRTFFVIVLVDEINTGALYHMMYLSCEEDLCATGQDGVAWNQTNPPVQKRFVLNWTNWIWVWPRSIVNPFPHPEELGDQSGPSIGLV